MNEWLQLTIGTLALIMGFPIGNILRKKTMDEQVQGKKYFILLTIIGLLGGIFGLILKKDWMLFTFLFIAIVSSRSIRLN